MDREDVLDLLSLVASTDNRTIGDMDVALWHQLLGKYGKDDCCDAIIAHRREQPGVWLEPGHVVQRVKAVIRDRYERADPDTRDRPYGDIGGLPPTHSLSSGRYVDPDGGYIDSNGLRRDRHGVVDKSVSEIEYDDGWGTEQRLDTYWRYVREQNPEYAGLTVRPATAKARDAAMRQIIKTIGKMPDDDGDDKPRINALLVACPFCKAYKGQPCRTPGVGKMRRSPGHPSRITEAAIAAGHTPDEAQRISDEIHAKVMRKYRPDVPRANTPWTPQPVGCPDCGSFKHCEHDSQPPPEDLYRFDPVEPRFPDSDMHDRAYERQQATAGLE